MKRKNSLPLKLLVQCIVFLALTGCATRQIQMTNTGFLSDYSLLKEDKASRGMHVYKNPDIDMKGRYSKIVIAPVEFELDPTLKGRKLKFEDRQKLSDYFYNSLKGGLEQDYVITREKGEGVLLLRTAITGVLPNKVYLNLHWTTTLSGAGIGGAALEAELVDSLTGERIMAFVDARKGRNYNYPRGLTKWGHTKEVLKIWRKVIVKNIATLAR